MKYIIVYMQKLKITMTFKVLHTLNSLAFQLHLLFPNTDNSNKDNLFPLPQIICLCYTLSLSSNVLASHFLPFTCFPSSFYQTSRFRCLMTSYRHSSLTTPIISILPTHFSVPNKAFLSLFFFFLIVK